MLPTAISAGTTVIVVPLFFKTPFVGSEVIRRIWSVSKELGSENPGVAGTFEALNIAAEKVRVVSSFVLGLMFERTGGCSTAVTVGSLVPPTVGSSVKTGVFGTKFVPETLPWFEIVGAVVPALT